MYQLTIQDDEGQTRSIRLGAEAVTIGRKEGNAVRLCERNVSRYHARLLREAAGLVIEDLNSFNGTEVNGLRISGGRALLGGGDRVRIGDFELSVLLPTPPPLPGPVQLPHPVPPPTRLLPVAPPAAEITAETLRPVRSGLLGLLVRALRGLRRSFLRLYS